MWFLFALLCDSPSVVVQCNPPDIVIDELWRTCL